MNIGGNGEFRIWKGPNPEEFSFLLNGEKVTGKTGWDVANIEPVTEGEGNGYGILLTGSGEVNRDIQLQVIYLTYPNLPVIRKRIVFANQGKSEIRLENIDTECLSVAWGNTHNVVWQNYGRYKHLGPYIGDWDDPAVMEEKHQIMLYRQDLQGFGEPGDGRWDGFQRINTETKTGGIAGVFRQNAKETERTVTISMLDPDKIYQVKEAVSNKPVAKMSGKDLQNKGFRIVLDKTFDSALFEISQKN